MSFAETQRLAFEQIAARGREVSDAKDAADRKRWGLGGSDAPVAVKSPVLGDWPVATAEGDTPIDRSGPMVFDGFGGVKVEVLGNDWKPNFGNDAANELAGTCFRSGAAKSGGTSKPATGFKAIR